MRGHAATLDRALAPAVAVAGLRSARLTHTSRNVHGHRDPHALDDLHRFRQQLLASDVQLTLSQGKDLNRPSTLYAQATADQDAIQSINIGGGVRLIGPGRLRLPAPAARLAGPTIAQELRNEGEHDVGKGKRLRAQRVKDQSARRTRELAPEPSRPVSTDDMGGGRMSSYTRQEIGKQVYAWMIILSYLEGALDGADGMPENLFAPQKPDESDEEYVARIKTDHLVVKTRAMAGSPAEQVAEVLSSWVPRSLVPGVVDNLAAEGLRHLDTATPDPDQWQANARPLLGILCPPQHWEAALDQLEALATSRLKITGAIAEHLTDQPVATVHAAAALVTWLYGRPDVIADPAAARLELAERAGKFGTFVF